MADARVVSNKFVELAENANDTLTPMQILKLVYIAHGYHLGIFGTPLIDNRIEAWKFGPVIPDLYHSIKHFRDKPVKAAIHEGIDPLGKNESVFVREVYEAYKGIDGITLSNLTHKAGTPWATVYSRYITNIPIPDDLIQHHYSAIVAE